MPELATPTRYNIPLLQFNPQPVNIGPLAVDQRGAAKAALWGSIANAISSLPDTLLKSYEEGQKIKRQKADDVSKAAREKLLSDKLQEASIPSAVAVDSTANKSLGVLPGTTGGSAAGKPALSDFTVAPGGITYNPEDPALRQAKAAYYSGRGTGKTAHGVTFNDADSAIAAGYNPEGADINPDGTITIKQFKSREEKGKRLTEGEQKTTTYVTRATAANKNVEEILKTYDPTKGRGAAETIANKIPILGNFMVSEDQQKMKQAADEFATAILRKDTGAAISKAEREEVFKTYIPQPGDGPQVLQQKSVARQRAIDALKESLPKSDQRAAAAAERAGAVVAPLAEAPVAKADPNGMVRVISPDGKTGRIPASQLQKALTEGYKQAP